MPNRIQTSLRLPRELHERLKAELFETGLSQNKAIVKAVELWLGMRRESDGQAG